MKVIKEKDEITFKAEGTVDGFKIGIMKEKFKKEGIPVKLGMNIKDSSILEISISQKDLVDILC